MKENGPQPPAPDRPKASGSPEALITSPAAVADAPDPEPRSPAATIPSVPMADASAREDPRERARELATLYEAARALIGARDEIQVATRIVHATLGAVGARSGALLARDARGRYRLLFGAGIPESAALFTFPEPVREWMLRSGAFVVEDSGAARAMGALQVTLVERFDMATGAAVADREGLAALLIMGPLLLEERDPGEILPLLESLATLAGHALEACATHDDPGRRPASAERARPIESSRPSRALEKMRADHEALASLIGDSPALLEVAQDLVAVAGTHFPVLLTGESGVGKELAARAIHDLSARRNGPFEVVDCGSIPRELIESELFGHVRGSFTGAHRDRRGAFELAARGTLFMDEIGEMPLELQTRLLRVLQEGRFRRVGDERLLEADVRVIAATNRDLRADVAARKFREDLFYRLNVFAILLPPLRDRLEDLIPLLRHFLTRQARELGVREWEVSADVVRAMHAHTWPGNIREVANFCAGLAVRSRGTGQVTMEDLDYVWRRQHPQQSPPWRELPQAGRGHLGSWVLDQVRASRFNLIEAARLLKRRQRAGQTVPLTERSALSYYLTGEILRAVVECGGDAEEAARRVAGDDDLAARVVGRAQKVVDLLRESESQAALRRRFAKLPADYQDVLASAYASLRRDR